MLGCELSITHSITMLGIFLDSETNGLNPFIHNIIELAYKIVDLATGKEIYKYESIIFQSAFISRNMLFRSD